MESLLEPLERAANELPPGQQQQLLHSDFEREAILQLGTNVDLELGQLLTDLREMADQVNAATTTTAAKHEGGGDVRDSSATVHQVTRILNCHMHSLNWIHQNTR